MREEGERSVHDMISSPNPSLRGPGEETVLIGFLSVKLRETSCRHGNDPSCQSPADLGADRLTDDFLHKPGMMHTHTNKHTQTNTHTHTRIHTPLTHAYTPHSHTHTHPTHTHIHTPLTHTYTLNSAMVAVVVSSRQHRHIHFIINLGMTHKQTHTHTFSHTHTDTHSHSLTHSWGIRHGYMVT